MKKDSFEKAELDIQKIGNAIEPLLPKGYGLVLALASFGEGGKCTYISSVDRSSTLELLKELAQVIEQKGFSIDM